METKEQTTCLCGTSEYNVVCCSGASDLGQLSDVIATVAQATKWMRAQNLLNARQPAN